MIHSGTESPFNGDYTKPRKPPRGKDKDRRPRAAPLSMCEHVRLHKAAMLYFPQSKNVLITHLVEKQLEKQNLEISFQKTQGSKHMDKDEIE